jgi:hypothetical protein
MAKMFHVKQFLANQKFIYCFLYHIENDDSCAIIIAKRLLLRNRAFLRPGVGLKPIAKRLLLRNWAFLRPGVGLNPIAKRLLLRNWALLRPGVEKSRLLQTGGGLIKIRLYYAFFIFRRLEWVKLSLLQTKKAA